MKKLGLCKCNYGSLKNGKYYYYSKLAQPSYIPYDYFIYNDNDYMHGSTVMSKYEFAVYFYDEQQIRKLKLNKLKIKN